MVRTHTRRGIVLFASVAVLGIAILPTAANAATTIDGPIGLGTAETFAVLGGSAVTVAASGSPNVTTISGDIGISPTDSYTGESNVNQISGTVYRPGSVADQAQIDLTTAYNTAAGLTPVQSGLTDLTDLSLVPGVYSGGSLSVNGNLTLAGGDASSVWVFQASSSLIIAGAATITVDAPASACNVIWQVGTSATIGGGANFVGTVMADQAISVGANATVQGRLLARIAAVTLDSDTIIRPAGCSAAGGTVSTSPTITSAGPLAGTAGTEYSYQVTASGTPAPTFSITAGTLPAGLVLDASGVISGTPTTPGTYTFTVTASNGTAPDSSATYTVSIAAPTVAVQAGEQLAESGSDVMLPLILGGALVTAGVAFSFLASRARNARRR